MLQRILSILGTANSPITNAVLLYHAVHDTSRVTTFHMVIFDILMFPVPFEVMYGYEYPATVSIVTLPSEFDTVYACALESERIDTRESAIHKTRRKREKEGVCIR